MTTDNDLRSTSTAMAVASLCIELIREDKGLLKRLQKLSKQRKAPFDHSKLDEHVLYLVDQAVTTLGFQAARDLRHDHQHGHVMVPIPQDAELADQSAGALAGGSYAVEYIRTSPEVMKAYSAWWDERHPDAQGAVTADRMESIDEMLTFMAATVSAVAQGKAQAQDATGHRHTETVNVEQDDGIRYV